MIEYIKKDIFQVDAEILVNPVNTDGVMGKGLAYQFKKKYDSNHKIYIKECKMKRFGIGDLIITKEIDGKIIVNFPTKTSWRENSKIEYIQVGLNKLKEYMIENSIYTVALPPLGAGNGKLSWDLVKKEIEIFYSQLDEMKFTVHVCEPEKLDSKLSKSHLLLLKLIVETYKNGIGKEKLTDIVFYIFIYLFDILMNRDFFKFDKEKKGPFSKLTGVLYNELKKYKNLSGLSLEEMSKYLEQKYTSETLEKEDRAIIKSIKLVNELYKLNSSDQEFEDQLELVTSILYLMNIENKSNEEEIVDGIVSWNKRKKEKYDSNKIVNTIKYMQNENIIQKGIFQNYTINRI